MPPTKRKRPERSSVDGGDNRPSPHRPQNAAMAQHDRGDMRDGQRRSSRGGQGNIGGRGGRRNDGRDNPNKLNISNTGRATPGPMSPPPRPSSATATPTQTPAQTPTPTPTVDPPLRKREPAYYYYEFLTDERMASWEVSGRAEVIARGTQAREDEDPMDLSSVMQELTRAALDGRVDAADAGICLKEILGPQIPPEAESPGAFDPHTLFLDVISVMCEFEEPVNPCLRNLFIESGISASSFRQNIESSLLQSLGLTRDAFSRVGVRQATNLLYRQANYNLLREESEGYSKLITELFTTSGSEPPTRDVVEETFEKVKALIGTFDLDVGRVLDLTMDVFAAVLVKHHRFFVKLLRLSSWWPRDGELDSTMRYGGLPTWALPSSSGWVATEEDDALSKEKRLQRDLVFWDRAREVGLSAFFELGGRPLVTEEMKQLVSHARKMKGEDKEGDLKSDEIPTPDEDWIAISGTLPPPGNRVAAQLLGFKLRFYASQARDKEDVLPANLIYLAALLIKIGFISLRDLYPHLGPADEDMPALKEFREKKLAADAKRAKGGGENALTRAGALSDDSVPATSRTREPPTTAAAAAEPAVKPAEAEDKDKQEPSDQKAQLLTCLLTIGAIPEALFILGKFPWLLEVYPDLVDLINRILNHSIDQVYRTCRPVSDLETDLSTKKVASSDQTGMPKGQVRLTEVPIKKQLKWPFPDKFDTNESTSYRFYWDEWADKVPVCQNVDDVVTICDTFVNLVGSSIGKDANLLSKLVRIGHNNLSEDRSSNNLKRWEILLRRLIVPALSITKGNTQIANEIWSLLRFYSVHDRYSIYTEWFLGSASRKNVAVRAAFDKTKAETINIMKRISKNNISTMARTLAKLTFSSPGIVFDVALGQIEAYDNLIEVVVECAKYFSDLGFDVLVWALATSLSGKRNPNNTSYALLPSKWLLALSSFSGKVFKRYSIINLIPIIKYVNHRLYENKATELIILKELITQMAGVYPSTDYGNEAIIAMTGGEKLRKYTLIELLDKRHLLSKTGERLMQHLQDANLVGELLIAIAQYRQTYVYGVKDADSHIKLLATVIDDTQAILSQYLDFLRSNLSVLDFDEQVPGITDLITEYGLQPELAFMVGRASVAYYKASHASVPNGAVKTVTPPTETVDGEGDVNMGEVSTVTAGESSLPDQGLTNRNAKEDTPMTDIKEEERNRSISVPEPQSPTITSGNSLSAIIETVKDALPESTFRTISPEFYVTFWTSALNDINVPRSSYDKACDDIMKKLKELASGASSRDTRTSRESREKERQALEATRQGLSEEMQKLVVGFGVRKSRYLKTKADWFLSSARGDEISDTFLEKCLLPRLLMSPVDAEYSFKMIRFLHDNGVPHFRTLSLYNRFFKSNRLRTLIFACTVREAENLGRFMRLALTDLARWHADRALYEKEAHGQSSQLIGFAKAVDEEGNPKSQLDYDGTLGFKPLLWKWHQNLNTAIRDCLDGTEWMHIRNAFTILKSVSNVFPAVDFQGNAFKKQLEVIIARETGEREDLTLMANTILVNLKLKTKDWVMVQAFHSMISTNGTQSTGKSVTPSTSQSFLKPTAPDFVPQTRASSLGVATPKVSGTLEVEDGEVDDAKVSAPTATAATKPQTRVVDHKSDEPRPTIEPRKSEILDRRDQIKRDNAAKASTPPPSHTNIPPRPDARTSILDRASPSLPNRPDAPIPSRDLLDRHPSRYGDRRDGRDSRPVDGRERPGNRPGDRPRDYAGGDRRAVEPMSRDFGRPSERGPGSERARIDPPPRWTAETGRENHDRSTNGTRAPSDGRLSRDMAPPRLSSDRGPANTERTPQVNPDRQELINPERAALITGDNDASRSDSPRRGRDDARERTSRPQSPRRLTSDKTHSDSRRDDRMGRNASSENLPSSRGRVEEPQPPPAGPRSDRTADRDRGSANDRSIFQPPQPLSRNMDLDHGRLNAGVRQQPDPNFGRLNPAPPSDVPSGPRDRTSRGNRPISSSNPRRDGRSMDTPRATTPEKQPPTGPAGNRPPRHTASGKFEPIVTTGVSAPTTPAVTSPAAGIHPDRLKVLGTPVPAAAHGQSVNSIVTPPIHPDRLRALNSDTPVKSNPQRPMHNDRGRPNMPPIATAMPPSGPKGSQSSPTIPQNGFAAPTGPASATERAARGNRHQLAGINTMLQQAHQNVPNRMNTRGRGGRMSSGMGFDTPNSGPPTPSVVLPSPPPPPPGPPPANREAGRELINPERADLITGGVAPVDDRDRDRNGRRERSGRHSRRSSRSPARERDVKRGSEEERLRSEYRDRTDRPRGDRGEIEKERHQPRSSPPRESGSGRDGAGGRDPTSGRDAGNSRDGVSGRDASGRDGVRDRERERERDRDSGRRDGREGHGRDNTRDGHGAGWNGERGGSERGPSGRSRDLRGDHRGEERRDGRGNREDSGRKRHSDEGMDRGGRDPKRPRRG